MEPNPTSMSSATYTSLKILIKLNLSVLITIMCFPPEDIVEFIMIEFG